MTALIITWEWKSRTATTKRMVVDCPTVYASKDFELRWKVVDQRIRHSFANVTLPVHPLILDETSIFLLSLDKCQKGQNKQTNKQPCLKIKLIVSWLFSFIHQNDVYVSKDTWANYSLLVHDLKWVLITFLFLMKLCEAANTPEIAQTKVSSPGRRPSCST